MGVINIDYNDGRMQIFYLIPGRYTLECWGAGITGRPSGTILSRGGYSQAIVDILVPTNIHVCVGGAGMPISSGGGGYNGGGAAGNSSVTACGGGGATHMSFFSGTLDNDDVRKNIILVAGGMGGHPGGTTTSWESSNGGGTTGAVGKRTGGVGTQTEGGVGTSSGAGGAGANGSEGKGGKGGNMAVLGGASGGGGGGGWFGGGGGTGANASLLTVAGRQDGGGGGSGYAPIFKDNRISVISSNTYEYVNGWNSSNPSLGNHKRIFTENEHGAARITSDVIKAVYKRGIYEDPVFFINYNGVETNIVSYNGNTIILS